MTNRLRLAVAALVVAASAAFTAPAGATTAGFDTQANNPQVKGDATSNTSAVFPTNKQNEPTIAVNPLNSRLLIAGSNDEQTQPPCGPGPVRGAGALPNDCSFFPGIGTDGIYTSADGGKTWRNRGMIDDQASWAGKGVISDGDPVITYGPKPNGSGGFTWANGARAYYSSLATLVGAKGAEYVIVSYSDDNGATWSAPVVGTTRTSSTAFNDKNWLTVDTTATSPFFGRLYLSWTQFRSNTATGNGSEPVMVSVSADGGLSFGAPNQLSPAGNNGTGNGRQGSSGTVGPDGTAYVAFEQGPAQAITVSRDGGKSWTRPATIAPVVDIDDPIPGANFRTDSFPVIAADPRTGSTTVHAAWATKTGAGGRVVLATSTDRGATWSAPVTVSGNEGYAFFPGLDVAPDGRVDVAWQALVTRNPATFGTGNASIDAWAATRAPGRAFAKPVKISTVSSDPAASAQNNLELQFWGDYNTVTSDASGAWFVYTDSRRGIGCAAVDAYQHFLADTGAVIREDEEDVEAQRETEVNPALSDPVSKPAPGVACKPDAKGNAFGNTDIEVSRFTP